MFGWHTLCITKLPGGENSKKIPKTPVFILSNRASSFHRRADKFARFLHPANGTNDIRGLYRSKPEDCAANMLLAAWIRTAHRIPLGGGTVGQVGQKMGVPLMEQDFCRLLTIPGAVRKCPYTSVPPFVECSEPQTAADGYTGGYGGNAPIKGDTLFFFCLLV